MEVDSTPLLNVTKSVSYPNHTCAQLGDAVTFTVLITNTGKGVAIAPWFIDPLPSGLIYESGSSLVSLNGAQFVPGEDPTIGFALPNLKPDDSVRLTFRATVATLPPLGNHFINIAEVIYCVDSEGGCTVVSRVSEKTSVLVNLPSPIGILDTCHLIHRTVYTFTITWNIPFVNVQRYRIFFEGNLIEELPGGQPLYYRTRLCGCDPTQFSVQADYGSNNITPVTPVRVE